MADEVTPEVQAERDAKVMELSSVPGVTVVDNVRADYFGAPAVYRVTLPDGVSYVEHKAFNEGAKRKYLNAVNKDVRLNRVTKDAVIKLASGDDRYQLLKATICGWDIHRDGKPFQFTEKHLETFLDEADPDLVDLIEKDVREHNPWLDGEQTVEELEAAREALDEQIVEAKKREAGKSLSSN